MAIVLLAARPVAAQDEHRAGLVVAHGDGSVITRCVAFAAESISGAELLTQSGLDLSVEASSMGATVCRIDGEGCGFPEQSCFCECEGSPCIYWSYWRLTDGEWRYRNIGAGGSTVRNGEVDGWRWGLGTIDKAEAPPKLTFEEICADELAPAAVAQVETAAPSAVENVQEETQSDSATAVPPTVSPAALSSVRRSTDSETAITPAGALLALLGVVVALPLLGVSIVALRRAGERRRA